MPIKSRNHLVLLIIASLLLACAPESKLAKPPKQSAEPYLLVLGIAQDAGYPQASCYRPHCLRARQNPRHQRKATALAMIDPISHQKWLFEATPDLPAQLYALQSHAPDQSHILAGVFLTHGHMGHYTGLMHFGLEAAGSKSVPVYAMPRMQEYLTQNGPWSQLVKYKNIELKPLQNGTPQTLNSRISVTPFLVPHRDEFTETVGFEIRGPNKTAIFIPDIDKWEKWGVDINSLIQSVDYAFLDATFFADGELPGRSISQVPHPFVSESMQRFETLTKTDKAKIYFIHFNHTNPLLIKGSKEQQLVREAGFNFAEELQVFKL